MRETPRFNGYDATPIYTMKTVVQQTGITPTTLRAWERRYGILQPDRTDGGYRLYSEQDIALLQWLKSQVEAGVNIGRAVALLEHRRQEGSILNSPSILPALQPMQFKASPEPQVAALHPEVHHADATVDELLHALLAFCETKAATILSEAFALHSLEVVAEQVIVPALTELGERWQRGGASVVQANFVITFLRQRVSALFAAYTQPASGPLAITGAAPGEWHDIGVLLLSLALRRQGWRVLCLGQNVPASQLLAELPTLRPELVCLSATTVESAGRLLEASEAVSRLPEPRPRFLFGGRAFNLHPDLCGGFPEACLGATASEAAAALTAVGA